MTNRWISVALSAGVVLAGCATDGDGGAGADGGAGGANGEQPDAENQLGDVSTGGNVAPGDARANIGGQMTGGVVADAGGGAGGVGGTPALDLGPPPGGTVAPPDAGESALCAEHEVIDLNAWLVDHPAYDGDTAAAPATLAASCGGAAGGELVFKYRVSEPLDRITFRTDYPETRAPTVLYVRIDCEEPVDAVCNRGSPAAPGTRASVDGPVPGTYYVIVDTGSRDGGGAFRLGVEENGASACRDSEDNDEDGLFDLTDPGCEAPEDDSEIDPPAAPQCADTIDNDSNGAIDFPADELCSAAGDNREGPVCALEVPTTDVDVGGGLFNVNLPMVGPDLAQGSCTFEVVPEHLFILTLDRAASVQVFNRSLNQLGIPVGLYARTVCGDRASELGCADIWRGSLSLPDLQPGVYFIFAEYSQGGRFDGGGPVPFGGGADVEIEFVIRPTNPTCSDTIDNDRDGLADLADPGCVNARDENEDDPPILAYCANGQDDDGDGDADYPADEGCTGAGDRCEEVGFDLCEGVCQDVVTNASHCGSCGTVCDEGVECIDGVCGGVYVFSGYAVQLPEVSLLGWEQCFQDTYADASDIGAMRQGCDGDLLLVACRQAGSDTLDVAAMGLAEEVFQDTGDGANATHEHNGVAWYFSENYSMGFVPAGAIASRNSCDTNALPEGGMPDDGTGEGRICWHTSGNALQNGYRCGLRTSGDQGFERVVYTSRAALPVRDCSDGRDNDDDGRIDGEDPECEGPLDDAEAAVPTECADGLDQNGNEAVDLLDAACRSPWDATEEDGRAVVALCGNGVDDDEDGDTDFPADLDCRGIGDQSEAPRCAAEADVLEVGQEGADFQLIAVDGNEGQAGSCGDGDSRAQIVALTLSDPSSVSILVSANGQPVSTPIHIRRACDDPASEIVCHFDAMRAAEWRVGDLDRGLYYVFFEHSTHRTPWDVNLRVVSNIRQCNDLEDNDEDGLIDALDLGCRTAFDDQEGDDPEIAPECADGVDNDDDGVTDYPDDANCVTAGDPYERLFCEGLGEVQELPVEGGVFPVVHGPNAGPYQGSCGDGPIGEVAFLLHLDDPSFVEVGTYSGPVFGNFLFGTTYIRRVCDDPNSEVICAGDNFDGSPAQVQRLEPGDYFIISEFSQGWQPGDPNLVPELHLTVRSLLQACENGRDEDGDGLTDLFDTGCEGPTDTDEEDVEGRLLLCANGEDDDGDGNSDWPDDDGCGGAGDQCEEPDYIQCDGVCLDGTVDPSNCGVCGTVCDRGVDCIDGYCGGAVPIFPNDAFGHHGSCDAWNSCNDARGCADAACRLMMLGPALSFDEGSCQGLPPQGIRCNLFFDVAGGGLDYDPDYMGCELPVAYNILCSPAP